MANTKVTALTAVSAAAAAMVLPVVEDPSGTPVTKKVSLAQIKTLMLATLETDFAAALTNVTTGNVSITKHGLTPILPSVSTQYLNGVGGWSTPATGAALLPWHNVKDYGAIGQSDYHTGGGHDDTQAFKDARDAAIASGGNAQVIVPSGTYRISSTLTWPQSLHLIGMGSSMFNASGPPRLLWDGADAGVMIDVAVASSNIFGTMFKNICIASGSGITNKLACGIRYRGTGGNAGAADGGSGLENVWFEQIVGNGLELLGGATNFFIRGGRFDAITGGWGIYSGRCYGRITIDGMTNWVGGGATNGKGFIRIDGETAVDGEDFFLTINGIQTEMNDPIETSYASGTKPYDKAGLISLGVPTGVFGMQYHLSINGWDHNPGATGPSYSAILMTGPGSAEETVTAVSLSIHNSHGLHSVAVNDDAVNNEVRLLGGNIPAGDRYPFVNYEHQTIEWGRGKDSGAAGLRSWIHTRHGNFATRGLAIVPGTVATLEAVADGALAIVTDSNASTRGATVAGGGSTVCLVLRKGSAWTIV